jgi:hypothetical protein
MKKGDIVKFKKFNEEVGFVVKGGRSLTVFYYCDRRKKNLLRKNIPEYMLEKSHLSKMHSNLKSLYKENFAKLRKGDLVSFDIDSKKHTGVVKRGGNKSSVMFLDNKSNVTNIDMLSSKFKKLDKTKFEKKDLSIKI